MELSESQIAQYDEQGYLFFPGLLDADEAAVLQGALPEILSREGPGDRYREGGRFSRSAGLWRAFLF